MTKRLIIEAKVVHLGMRVCKSTRPLYDWLLRPTMNPAYLSTTAAYYEQLV